MHQSDDMTARENRPLVLLTGATGYIGSRLLPRLERQGVAVRCLARHPDRLEGRVADTTQLAQGDVTDRTSLEGAFAGVETAYYLVHLMASSSDFEAQDRKAAVNFAAAARSAGVRRIVYMGGLGDESDPDLSPHLRSRHEVGAILRDGAVNTIELRASVVIGRGSLSFDLIRALTERLPVMICPRWLSTPTQPIAISDVLDYLEAARTLPESESGIFEIGCCDVVTYGELIEIYARLRGLRRYLISVPLLTPYLSSLWLGLVTPTSAEVGRHLIEGLRNPTIVQDARARDVFPIEPMGVRDAIAAALDEKNREAGI